MESNTNAASSSVMVSVRKKTLFLGEAPRKSLVRNSFGLFPLETVVVLAAAIVSVVLKLAICPISIRPYTAVETHFCGPVQLIQVVPNL